MVPFERAIVTSYRPSIVTFPLSLRVSEILPLLFSSTPFFSHPTSSLPQISPCSPRSRWMVFGLRRVKVLGYVSMQLVSKISNLCYPDPPTSQTNRRTTCNLNTALCTNASRGKNTQCLSHSPSGAYSHGIGLVTFRFTQLLF